MNYYLIWTDKGWMKSPIYNRFICEKSVNDVEQYDEVSTTYNIRRAYRFNNNQIESALKFLHAFGVASWAVESKEDMLEKVIQEIRSSQNK